MTLSWRRGGWLVAGMIFRLPQLAGGQERTWAEVQKRLAEINQPSAEQMSPEAADRDAALRRLKAYRYLAGVPYADLKLDDEFNRLATAAADLCAKVGRIDHNPTNPGLPEAEYKTGLKGTRSCSLSFGFRTLPRALDLWMDDSDPGNIPMLGHRRWCLNPTMAKTGFGRVDTYAAMYVLDRCRTRVPDFDFVAWPPPGPVPTDYFKPRHPWNVSLNPRKYARATDAVKPKVYEADADGNPIGEPMPLDYTGVSHTGMGIPNCVIFRPTKVEVADGKSYVVEIDGLTRADGKKAPRLRYVVRFHGSEAVGPKKSEP